MDERRWALAGALAVALGIVVLLTGTFLSPHQGLDALRVVVLLLSVAGATQVVIRLRNDLVLGAAMALAFFLPYAVVSGVEVHASSVLPTFVLIGGVVVTARFYGLNRGALRDPLVRWMLLYVAVVCGSALLNFSRLSKDSFPFLALWLLAETFFLVYLLYRPCMTLEQQMSIAQQYLGVLVMVSSLALILGVVEYLRPEAVQPLFAPQGRVGLWGARGALSDWLVPLRRTGSIIGSPNAFGSLLAMGALTTLGRRTSPRFRDVLLASILGAGVVVLSTSRGATVGLLSGVAVYVLTSKRRIWALPLLVAALVMGAFMPATVEFIGGGYVPEEAIYGRSLPAAAERLVVWQRALAGNLGVRGWLIGAGPINEPFVIRTALRGGHNLIVTNLEFFGLVGVLCVLALCREIVLLASETLKDPRTRMFARVGLAIFVALVVHSLVDDMLFYNTSTMLVFFPLLAMLARMRQLVREDEPSGRSR